MQAMCMVLHELQRELRCSYSRGGLQGSGGAFEISQRMTAMLGWGATVFQEDWTWTQSSEMYVLDEEMAATLRRNNPEVPLSLALCCGGPVILSAFGFSDSAFMQAFRNVVARMLEAAGRGMWDAPEETLQKLQETYADLDEQLEKVDSAR